jgi:hypothetical protein
MRRLYTYPRSLVLAAVAALFPAICATALAAHPKANKTYTGDTSAPAINGHRGPVSFKVSSNGRSLLAFKYGNIGCIPGGTIKGNPYTSAANIINVGTIAASSDGSFSAPNAKSTYVNSKVHTTTVTISMIMGKFKTAKSASGTISFTQNLTGPGGFKKSCGPLEEKFTATTK